MVIVLGIMAVFAFISLIMLVVYCHKHRKIKREEAEDQGILNRQQSYNFPGDNKLGQRLYSVNNPDSNPQNEISLDDGEHGNSKLDTTPNQFV